MARGAAPVVLVVDDTPEQAAVLHDALDEAGFTVLVATDGPGAIERARRARPDIVLLDAAMPGTDSFDVARRLKATDETLHIPIVFMAGHGETEHVVQAYEAGGADYVTRPVRAAELLARMGVHLRHARHGAQARNALDAFGHAAFTVRGSDGRLAWQTPLARRLLREYLPHAPPLHLPPAVAHWVAGAAAALRAGRAAEPFAVEHGARRLRLVLHEDTGDGEWLVVMRESSAAAAMNALGQAFRLTARESQVLYWVAAGKTNRDIGDILGTSPRTVNKQLEHVFEKLGVETRTAAASLAMQKVSAAGYGG